MWRWCPRRGGRALRLLLLLVVVLTGLEFLIGTWFEAGPLRVFSSTSRKIVQQWPKRIYPQPVEEKADGNKRNGSQSVVTDLSYFDMYFLNDTVKTVKTNSTIKEKCPSKPPGLVGEIGLNISSMTLQDVARKFSEVQSGGRYAPTECIARQKVAIITPFRDRAHHLAVFLNHMHPFLMKQQLDYGIFIIEQSGALPFNRAKLMNVGFKEAQRLRPDGGWDCFIFHDIDLLPIDDRNIYSCPGRKPRHMAAAIDKFHYTLPYQRYFGGVSALTTKQFYDINGFSNIYWGWGGEDDDILMRIEHKSYNWSRYPKSIARYKALKHSPQKSNPKRFELLKDAFARMSQDGLSTLDYELISVKYHHLYTSLLVNIDGKSWWQKLAKFLSGWISSSFK